ncbi:uncharacterized protein LOC107026510 [Solanum pennellii]|uniref:Uncharacterized protein LOC107026510 n=1 Tax=Solanum pennellii TaxID=28526 RepID=A0ABM1HB40_SOLPN|nr:uncharacterized protein LOC107026510 [Solanum pennellii]XP_015082980.1 uncharacterized protein LOC107026510 [Solanum pennellii]XP_015082982.1 uncharacterized protein LOC107026510 [Solanum pennellii]XP_015082983.1 uncharacterized protein LOC107026510 [Solanum pennellii]XP_015082984.1 uncharacterized protein LOC107026510 [Solanum pennellii]XP_015082985.1 uncharacterized protein LOC107026510 [Solanum pennellii]XP_015082987.1 uncharacterized protein LOC107026510 [Solanum pennellii]XP_01508298
MRCKVPSLVDLCVQTAVDNLRYLGDVGETDTYLLERILPHCSLEQLTHVENSTEGRDLSQVTDRLWKRFYQIEFGDKSINQVVERMKQVKVTFKWKQLYEAKTQEMEETQQRSFERIKELYQNENAKRQSRQVQVCTKVPPSSNKRSFYGSGLGSNFGNTKSPLMKKAKIEFVNSREVKNLAALKNKSVQRNHSQVSFIKKPGSFVSSQERGRGYEPDTSTRRGSSTYPDTAAKRGSSTYPDTAARRGSSTYPDSATRLGSSTHHDTAARHGSSTYPDAAARRGSSTYPDTAARRVPSTYPDTTTRLGSSPMASSARSKFTSR